MHDGMPYGRNQGQGHSREVDRQSPTGLIIVIHLFIWFDAMRAHKQIIPRLTIARTGMQEIQ